MTYLRNSQLSDDALFLRMHDYADQIDAGKKCPTCKRKIAKPVRESALGVYLFRCPHCQARWFDLTGDQS